jgi:hypothetical protein
VNISVERERPKITPQILEEWMKEGRIRDSGEGIEISPPRIKRPKFYLEVGIDDGLYEVLTQEVLRGKYSEETFTYEEFAKRTVDGWFAEGKISEEKAKRLKEIIATQKEEVDYSVEEVFDIALKNNYTKIFM